MRYGRILLPLTMAALLAGCGGSSSQAPGPESANVPAANAPSHSEHAGGMTHHVEMPSMVKLQELSGTAFDATFASEMIEHHQGAVEMSEEALKAAKRDEVKEAARQIIEDQQKEIGQMSAWVKEWTDQEPDPELRRLMKTDMEPMMSRFTEECRADCDRAFLTHMKAHHQMAVEMAKLAAAKAEHAELKELANRIVESQSREIEQFDTWLKEWYGEAAR